MCVFFLIFFASSSGNVGVAYESDYLDRKGMSSKGDIYKSGEDSGPSWPYKYQYRSTMTVSYGFTHTSHFCSLFLLCTQYLLWSVRTLCCSSVSVHLVFLYSFFVLCNNVHVFMAKNMGYFVEHYIYVQVSKTKCSPLSWRITCTL